MSIMEEMPLVHVEDAIDKNKYYSLVTDMDIERQQKNINFLKENNIPCNEEAKLLPIDSLTELKTKNEILIKALICFITATLANYSLDPTGLGGEMSLSELLDELLYETGLSTVSIPDDIFSSFTDIVYKKRDVLGLKQDSWLYERSAVLLWAVGLLDKPSSENEIDVNKIFELITNNSVAKAKLRSKEEILEYADLVERYAWAIRDAKRKGISVNLNEEIVQEQVLALDWALTYDAIARKKIAKEKVNLIYERGDFILSFDINTKYWIEDLFNNENSNILMSIRDDNDTFKSAFNYIDACNKDEYKNKVNADIDRLKDRWNIYSEKEMNFPKFSEPIKAVVFKSKIVDSGMVVFYLMANDNLISYESTIDTKVDFEDPNAVWDSIEKSPATKLLLTAETKQRENTTNFRI